MMEKLRQDLRSTIRLIFRKPAFAAVTVLTLALGIGANTAIFSVVYGVLLRPLPIKDPDRVMRLNETFLPSGWGTASAANFRDWRERNTVFEYLSAYEFQNFNLENEDSPVRVPGASVTADYLDTMGVQPELGRAFLPGEDTAGREHVALIGDKTWRSQFMADGNIVGRTIKLGGESYTIIGVMPEGFFFPSQLSQIWTPLVFTKDQLEHRGSHMFFVVGRMKRDVTLGQATSQMKGIARQIELEYPDLQAGRSVRITQLKDDMVVRAKPALLVLLGAVAAVLLICCVNVASLMLTNAASRRKETAVRAALGAGRWRLTRQFLTESVILSLLGGALGAAIAKPALSSLLALASTYLPRSKEVGLDLGVLGFTLGLSLVTGIVFGTVPALQASRADVRDALADGTRSIAGGASNRLRHGLVVAEIALSLALLIGAGLLIKSFNRLQQVSSGLNPDDVMTMQLSLPESHYLTDQLKVAFFKQALAKIEAAPGIDSAGTISLLPMQEWGYNGDFGIEGRPADAPGSEPSAEWRAVSSDYFRTLGIPVLEGRGFGNQDAANAPNVVIIDHALAERYFPGIDPVGKTLIVGASHARVVGVVGDVRQSGLSEPARPTLFLSYDQSPMDDGAGDVSLVVRGKTDPSQLVSTVREQILSIDRAQPVYNVKSMSQVIADSSSDARLNTLLLSVFAGLALLLAVIGVYGVISYSYAQRTREIGIRMALGALPSSVKLMALGEGVTLASSGVAIGLGLAFALTRTLASLLYSVRPADPVTYAVMVGILLAAALLACYIPARRASRVEPMSALRYE